MSLSIITELVCMCENTSYVKYAYKFWTFVLLWPILKFWYWIEVIHWTSTTSINLIIEQTMIIVIVTNKTQIECMRSIRFSWFVLFLLFEKKKCIHSHMVLYVKSFEFWSSNQNSLIRMVHFFFSFNWNFSN